MLVFVFSAPSGYSQVDSIDVFIEKLLEGYAETNDVENFDFNTTFENLVDLHRHPIDLNSADENKLSELFFLNPIQRSAIIQHREIYGKYLGIEELQSIPSMDVAIIKLMEPFVQFTAENIDYKGFKKILASGNSNMFLKYKRVLQEKAGYITDIDSGEKSYAGTQNHYFARYKFDAGKKLKFGFTAENDPGEAFFTGSNKKGFDYYSGFLYSENIWPWLKAISLGDYALSFGQGLILHNAFGTGKSAFVMNIKKSGATIRPYSSVNESNFFRGGAATISPVKDLLITLAYSNKNIDASIQSDTIEDTGFEYFGAIARDGLHRTSSEIAKKGSVSQINYGGKIGYTFKKLRLGLNYLTYKFSPTIQPTAAPYKLYQFVGNSLTNASIDYSYIFRNFSFFGEIAQSDNGGRAQNHGVLVGLDRHVDMALSYRNYEKNYQVLEANAFSEGSLPINEKGFYAGLEIKPNLAYKISCYVDFWTYPWLRYQIDAPSSGKEAFVRLEYNIKRKFSLYAQYRYEKKNTNSYVYTKKIDGIIPTEAHRFRVQASHKVNKELELRARAEVSVYTENGTSSGYLIFQDAIYKPIQKPYSFSARFCVFDAKSFDNRIYAYENDILYEYSIPFFTGRGTRFYINSRFRLLRNLMFELRYSNTSLYDGQYFGSGNEQIVGPNRSEIKTQFKWSF